MKNKQEVNFRGVDKVGRVFFTPNFESCALLSTIDPVPANRKSRLAVIKLMRGMEKNDKPETNFNANRSTKKEREKQKKIRLAAYLSERLNRETIAKEKEYKKKLKA